MKKTFLFAAVLGALTFTSCKKDYTCDCTSALFKTANSGVDITATEYSKVKKKDAEEACEGIETTYKSQWSDISCTLNKK